jgi:PAS domain S-box-containing protein
MAKKRRREELFAALDRVHAETPDDRIRQLLHELHVHGEELTVQNEQLLKAQAELEETRDRYADLYDLAPIGYLTLDVHGTISDINIAGAALLGRDRVFLSRLPIFTAITEADRGRLREFLSECAQLDGDRSANVVVETRREPKRQLRLVARAVVTGRREKQYFTSMFDVTEAHRLEQERAAALAEAQERATELAEQVSERLRAEERVKALLERLVTVQEEERRRIALNLHDHLGQQLTALRLTISALKDKQMPQDDLRKRIDAIDEIVAQIDKDVDILAWDLRPAALDDVGLNAAMAAFLRQWSVAQGIPAEFHVSSPEAVRLPPETESQLYRILQEALNNVSKHANATCVSVLVEQHEHEALLVIEDDGRGFDVERAANARGRHAGMGLIGMRERAAVIGGTVEFETAPGQGTTVFVRFPAARPAHPAA